MTILEPKAQAEDAALARGGRALAGIAVVGASISVMISTFIDWELVRDAGGFHLALWAIGIGAVAWVTMPAQARNLVVWALATAALFAALATAGLAAFNLAAPESLLELSFADVTSLAPSQLPIAAALSLNPVIWAWIPSFFIVLTVVLLLFPDGRPPSPRWRWVGWLSVGLLVVSVTIAGIWEFRPSGTTPYAADSDDAFDVAVILLAVVAVVASVAALIVKYRRSTGVTRHQIRWLAWAGSIFAITNFLIIIEEETTLFELNDGLILIVLGAAELLLIVSFAVAITKYRLYDIDVVISRTVTYGALAVFIAVMYVAIVAGIGSLFGSGDQPNVALAIGATAAVALVFDPIRSRLQRWANRLVFGERATPYEVLARFSKRAATAERDEQMLERIPRLIVSGTGASTSTLWVKGEDGMEPAAWWPQDERATGVVDVAPDGGWSDPNADHSVPVEHGGELLGGLSMTVRRGGTITPTEEELVRNLAGALGLVLRNARLTDDLRDQVDQLAASRERILSAADEARRGLERDLDMGPQQELVAVKVKLGVVKTRAEQTEASKTAEVLAQLEEEVGTAIESVRDFARGVYPPLLEADGLSAAISAEGDKTTLPVAIHADGIGRYPREVETAVFFSVLEALQNAAKYAEANTVTVRLEDDGERLRFEVSDDGVGFDPQAAGGGSGIPGMSDRIDAAGGTLSIESARGRGTHIAGQVPI